MPTQLQLRRGTTTEHSTFAGAVGEVTIDTTKDTAVVHDGATNGGYPLAKESGTTFGNSNVSGNITFADNSKAIFGGGSDLQIYHDSLNSYVSDNGTGNFFITTNGSGIYLRGSSDESLANFVQNDAVSLYFDNSLKFNTSSTGINVTGTAVTDGLTVAGNVSVDGGTIKLDGNYPVGTENVALGDAALDSLTSGTLNTAIGDEALTANTSGAGNSAFGRDSLKGNTTGDWNVGVGVNALITNTTGSNNVAIGQNTLQANTTASSNTAVGYQAGYSNTTGQNTFFGSAAGYTVTTGTNNVFLGRSAGNLTTSSFNTMVGDEAGRINSTGAHNTFVGGRDAGGVSVAYNNTTGSFNTALGSGSLGSNTTASNNTAVGYQAGLNATTGASNTFLGHISAGIGVVTGNHNVGVGAETLYRLSSGASNIAVGYQALQFVTSGVNNVAIGYEALENNTANHNTAVGHQALNSITTGSANVGIGFNAGLGITTGVYNTIMGMDAGESITTSSECTFIGRFAGNETTGGNNTFLGKNSGYLVTSGTKNTILGSYNGNQDGLDIRTTSNNIVLSDGDGNVGLHINSSKDAEFGSFSVTGASKGVQIQSVNGIVATSRDGTNNLNHRLFYNPNGLVGTITTNGSATSYNTSSDHRLKENVVDMTGAIDRVKLLSPKRFNFIADSDTTVDGFLAHEAQTVVSEAVTGTHNEVDDDGNAVMQGIDQSKLVPLLTGALKEAIAKIEDLEARIATLEGE